jgi:hypothetical protein
MAKSKYKDIVNMDQMGRAPSRCADLENIWKWMENAQLLLGDLLREGQELENTLNINDAAYRRASLRILKGMDGIIGSLDEARQSLSVLAWAWGRSKLSLRSGPASSATPRR